MNVKFCNQKVKIERVLNFTNPVGKSNSLMKALSLSLRLMMAVAQIRNTEPTKKGSSTASLLGSCCRLLFKDLISVKCNDFYEFSKPPKSKRDPAAAALLSISSFVVCMQHGCGKGDNTISNDVRRSITDLCNDTRGFSPTDVMSPTMFLLQR